MNAMISFEDQDGRLHGFDASGRTGRLRRRSLDQAVSVASMVACSTVIAAIITAGSFFMTDQDAAAAAAKAKTDLWNAPSATERSCPRAAWPNLAKDCLQNAGVDRPVRQIAITRTAGSTTFVTRAAEVSAPNATR